MLIFGLLIASTLVTLIDAGSWSVPISIGPSVRRNNMLKLSDVYGQGLVYEDDRLYRGTVYVGTPPVPFTVLFDTGSYIFWLPKKDCRSSGPHVKYCSSGLGLYDPDNSVTATHVNKIFNIKYGTGSARGIFFKDSFTFGGSMRFKKRIKIGAADVMEYSDQPILGLPSKLNSKEKGSSVMHEAWRQKLLDAPIFTIYLRNCPNYEECKTSGVISFGALDELNCEEVIEYIKINPESYKWQFTVSEFRIGRGRVLTPFDAHPDSGATSIGAPSNVVERIMREFGARASGRYHIVKCDVDATVTLTIHGHQYEIPSTNMLLNLHNGWCRVLLIGISNTWILGAPFTKTFCQVHNIETRTIGFAKARD